MITSLKTACLSALRYARDVRLRETTVRIAKTIWEIPAIRSKAITWLVRIGVPGAALVPLIIDAVWPR